MSASATATATDATDPTNPTVKVSRPRRVCVVPSPTKKLTELLPPREGITYKTHQEIGIRWMIERERMDAPWCRGGILADDMGLGKTFQTIGLMLNGPEDLANTLIVCPPALVATWTKELQACGFFVSTLFSGAAQWIPVPADWTGPVVWLITYPRVCMYYKPLLRSGGVAFDRVVLDEGHAIRNGIKTARGMACLTMAYTAKSRWILSATPVQNGIREWINLCQWLRVRAKRSQMPELADELMLRRTMSELRLSGGLGAVDLPPAPVFCVRDLSIPESLGVSGKVDDEYRYFHVLCDSLDEVLDDRSVSALVKLELYMRIQQFLVHPQVYIDGRRAALGAGAYPRGDWTGTATKWHACIQEDLATGITDRVGSIVFCQFRREMDMVAEAALALGAQVWSIRGGMSVSEIGTAVETARTAVEDGKPVVMVVQIVTGGVGLNLQFCRRVLFLSQHWNPAVVHQAVGRAVRIGQREVVKVFMYRIVDDVMDNLDLRMSVVHAGKIGIARELCPSFYEGYGGPAAEMLLEPTQQSDEIARTGGPASKILEGSDPALCAGGPAAELIIESAAIDTGSVMSDTKTNTNTKTKTTTDSDNPSA